MRGINKILFLLFLSFSLTTFSQTTEEVKLKAEELFTAEKYVEATPYYLRLLSLQPKDPVINYRYGACLLFNADRKEEALRYLKFAASDGNLENLSNYFIGRAYHLNYLFSDAIDYYEKYQAAAPKKESAQYEISRLIQMCQNGKLLLTSYSEMIVYDKKEIEADKFFRLYDLKDIGGNLLVTADFQSKIDKKKGHFPIIYFPKNATEIYYSSYGDNENTGKDIYRRKKLTSGGWGEPEILRGSINTQYDEDFAYMSQDGRYLYFCSKGHNSMGGYDVFKCKYDRNLDIYNEVENMDFAISSPDDDLLFLVDKSNQSGYFASARQSETGKVYIYKIRVEKIPSELSIIAGLFDSKINPQKAKLTVEVQDLASGKTVGTFQSDKQNQILLTFPKGGKYLYKMKTDNSSEIFTYEVSIPMQKAMQPMRQNFAHFNENGKEVVRVVDKFEENVPEKEEIIAQIFKTKAKLDPNSEQYDLNQVTDVVEEKKVLAKIGANSKSIAQVNASLKWNIERVVYSQQEGEAFEGKIAAKIEEELNEKAKLDVRIAEKTNEYNNALNPERKREILGESKALIEEQARVNKKIDELLAISDEFNSAKGESTMDAKKLADWTEKANQVDALLQSGKESEALKLIAENEALFKEMLNLEPTGFQETKVKQVEQIEKKLGGLNVEKEKNLSNLEDVNNKIAFQNQQKSKASKRELETIESNIAKLQQEANLIKEEVASLDKAITRQKVEKQELSDQLSVYNEVQTNQKFTSTNSIESVKAKVQSNKATSQSKDADFLADKLTQAEKEGPIEKKEKSEPKQTAKEEGIVTYNPVNPVTPTKKTEASNVGKIERVYTSQLEAISQDATLTPLQKNEAKQNLLKKKQEELMIEQKRVDYALLVDENDAEANREFRELEKLANETKQELEKLNTEQNLLKDTNNQTAQNTSKTESVATEQPKKTVATNETRSPQNTANTTNTTNNSTVASNNLTPAEISERKEELVSDLLPLYKELMEDLEKEEVAYADLYRERIELNKELLREVKGAQKDLVLEKDQLSNTEYANKTAVIQSLIADLENQIAADELSLKAQPESVEDVLNRLYPDYSREMARIDNSATLSTEKKLQRKLNIERVIYEKLELEAKEYDELIRTNPSNQNLKEKRGEVQQLLDAKSLLISAREDELAQLTDEEKDKIEKPVKNNERKNQPTVEEPKPVATNNEKTEFANNNPVANKSGESTSTENTKTPDSTDLPKTKNTNTSNQSVGAVNTDKTETELDKNAINTPKNSVSSTQGVNPNDTPAKTGPKEVIYQPAEKSTEQQQAIANLSRDYDKILSDVNITDTSDRKEVKAAMRVNEDLINELEMTNQDLQKKIQSNKNRSANEEQLATNNALIQLLKEDVQSLETQASLAKESNEELMLRLDTRTAVELNNLSKNPNRNATAETRFQELGAKMLDLLEEEKEKVESLKQAGGDPGQIATKSRSIEQTINKLQAQLTGEPEIELPPLSLPDEPLADTGTEPSTEQLLNSNVTKNVIQSISPDYTDQNKRLEAEINGGNSEKIDEWIALKKSFLLQLKAAKSEPNYKDEKEEIDLLIQTTQSEIRRLEDQKVLAPESMVELTNRLVPGYEEELDRIESTTEPNSEQRKKAENSLNEKLIYALNKELIAVESIEKTKENAYDLAEKKALLEETKKEAYSNMIENGQSENTGAAKPTQEQLIRDLAPTFQGELAAIQRDNELSLSDKTAGSIRIREGLKSSLEKEKQRLIKSGIASNIQRLEVIEDVLQSNDEELNKLNAVQRSNPETDAELIVRVDSQYNPTTKQANNEYANNPIQRKKKLNELDKSLVEKLEKEKYSVKTSTSIEGQSKIEKIEQIESIQARLTKDISTRSNELDQLAKQSNETTPNKYASLQEIRSDLQSGGKDLMTEEPSSLSGKKALEYDLQNYSQQLEEQIRAHQKNPNDSDEMTLSLLLNEKRSVEQKRRQISVEIGEMERQELADQQNKKVKQDVQLNDSQLNTLKDKESDLNTKLESASSPAEAKSIQNALDQVKTDKLTRENELLRNQISELKKANQFILAESKKTANSSATAKIGAEIVVQVGENTNSASTKLEAKMNTASTESEINFLLKEELIVQENGKRRAGMALIDGYGSTLTKGQLVTVNTSNELNAEKRLLTQRASVLESDIARLETQLKSVSDAKSKADINDQLTIKRNDLQTVQTELSLIESKITAANTVMDKTIADGAKKVKMTEAEEKAMAANPAYRKIYRAGADAVYLEKKIEALENTITKQKSEIKTALSKDIENQSRETLTKKSNQTATAEWLESEKQLTELKRQLQAAQKSLREGLPTDEKSALEMQFLISKGVQPTIESIARKEPTTVPGAQGSGKPFVIEPFTLVENPVVSTPPVITESPSGLTYRVQVGAFRNPVSETLYNEFTPVSGELRPNGLTVYMAGYFDSNKEAQSAQGVIRGIGYSDAFLVAYCDGERISLLEARQLEANGGCGSRKGSVITINGTGNATAGSANNSGTPYGTQNGQGSPAANADYNQAPGAAKATAIEKLSGLFFTVQVGVFNKPADPQALKEVDDLYTRRLENGQIRYSSGKFGSIPEAQVTKLDVVDKGITDAFVTAYYKSERITLAEAKRLLEENGNSILEVQPMEIGLEDQKELEAIKAKYRKENGLEPEVPANTGASSSKPIATQRFQFVSKATYDEFPVKELKGLNENGAFYYDSNDKKIKSIFYQSEEEVRNVAEVKKGMDMIYLNQGIYPITSSSNFRTVKFTVEENSLDGDLANYLIRTTYKKEFVKKGNKVEIQLLDVRSDKTQELVDGLSDLGIQAKVEMARP